MVVILISAFVLRRISDLWTVGDNGTSLHLFNLFLRSARSHSYTRALWHFLRSQTAWKKHCIAGVAGNQGLGFFMSCESFLHGASEAICVLFWVSPPIEVLVATPTCSLGVSVPALPGLRDRETLKPLLRGHKSCEMRASQSLVCRQQQEPLASPNLEKFERVRTSAVF